MKRRWWKRSKRPPTPVDPAIAAGENPAEDIGSTYPNEVQAFYFETLRYCGCGDPALVLELIRDVLQAMADRSDANRAGKWVDPNPERDAARERETALLGDPALGLAFRYMLDRHKLTEHGGSVFGAWPTDEGRRVLKMLVDAGDLEIAMRSEFE